MTTVGTDVFATARQVADAVLYEGYVLYPYRASSSKNQTRWQFGVIMPPGYVAFDSSERSATRTEVVFEAKADAELTLSLRFLHVAHRTGGEMPDWDETAERQVDLTVAVDALRAAAHTEFFEFAGELRLEDGVSRETHPVAGAMVLTVTELPGPYGALRLTVEVQNRTEATAPDRDLALRHALISAHSMFALDRGRFLSMTDPPEWAKPEVKACRNEGTWPVLADGDRVVLSSPIILGDNPEIAPESPGDLYDSTEIDEILILRTMTLTDAEKAEARATDPRSAELIDRVDALPQEQLDRLHGALRYLRHVTGEAPAAGPAMSQPDEPPTYMVPSAPWWDPGADASVNPDTDSIIIDGVRVGRGSRVRLRPGNRRTDAQDLFLRGRLATVEAVFFDVDDAQHLGVTVDDDPELAEISRAQGRFLYFAPDEVEPVQ
ncbi:hypothetical protein [Sporichthya sp.]|uniref:hypothetical protein n=1 Tax=Sporichthya sp. TaxID=65475 RepID=UPI00185B89DE|nr:hypothetical protein [Sporichthya sp.]MBA3743720.1 hypothetical protein [Sporichthya sp.]